MVTRKFDVLVVQKQCCSRFKTTVKERQKSVLHVQICFLLIRRKSVLHVQFVFLLIRSISLEAIFIVVPRLALHDLIFLFTRVINQSFAFSPG